MKADDVRYRGRVLDEYSSAELKDIIAEMVTYQEMVNKNHEKHVGFLNECRQRKRK